MGGLDDGPRKGGVLAPPSQRRCVSPKFVESVSPRSGRQRVARGVSRGLARPSLTPFPSPARAGEGCRRQGAGCPTQGSRPGLHDGAPGGAGVASPNRLDFGCESLTCETSANDGFEAARYFSRCKSSFASLKRGFRRTAVSSSATASDFRPRFSRISPNSRWAWARSGSSPSGSCPRYFRA